MFIHRSFVIEYVHSYVMISMPIMSACASPKPKLRAMHACNLYSQNSMWYQQLQSLDRDPKLVHIEYSAFCRSMCYPAALLISDSVSPLRAMPMRSCSTKIRYPTTAMTMKRMRTMRKMAMFCCTILAVVYVGLCSASELAVRGRDLSVLGFIEVESAEMLMPMKTVMKVDVCERGCELAAL